MENYNKKYSDIDECTSRGSCSTSPTINALEELSFAFLKNLAYYLLKLEQQGVSNEKINYEILNIMASHVTVNEFSEKQLYSIILNEYYMLNEAQKIYFSLNATIPTRKKKLNNIKNFNSDTTLSQAITKGEKLFLSKISIQNSEIRNLIEILNITLKSVCLNLLKLKDFGYFDSEIFHEVLETLNLYNEKLTKTAQIKDKINKLTTYDMKLNLNISDKLLKTFENISEVEVSHSTRKGKAILVSGNNFFDLLKILELTQDKDIDVYTHSNLLITHALGKFRKFKNLIGHYGNTTENCILDFATFPGAILLTQNSHSNNEYLYRGHLFSNDYITPNGVKEVSQTDYNEIINAALESKGFSKGKTKNNTLLGYNTEKIEEKFKQLALKLSNKKIDKLFIIGSDSHSQTQKAYFEDLFENLKKNEFVISFSYSAKKDNIYTIKTGNYTPLCISLLYSLFNKYNISNTNIVFFFTKCDVITVSSIINAHNNGADSIYMSKCQPMIMNPSVFETLGQNYNIKTTTTAIKDLENIRKKTIAKKAPEK